MNRGRIVTCLVVLCTCNNDCVTLGDVAREEDASNIMYGFVVSGDM